MRPMIGFLERRKGGYHAMAYFRGASLITREWVCNKALVSQSAAIIQSVEKVCTCVFLVRSSIAKNIGKT